MLEVYHCPHCRTQLVEYGEYALSFLTKIQDQYLTTKETVGFPLRKEGKKNQDLPIVKFLEKEGYLVTCEIDDLTLALKPTGIHEIAKKQIEFRQVFVCYSKDHHAHE